ncbi:hypothetical protein B7935_10335 [Streptococcus agalactiae]|uniref:hypothetical protein n=1 Tax=Streptococcus agalactiae TaxID=1311 RepID=UPI000A3599BA|nr:hypothetical protein [Streptococcus agalactiae]OTG44180.1 hypothetical protein B7936_09700 [Streptococcus agalactiae]OTG44821.1 hypothetical protein B7935_10335 [Streptococcus agalactiae]RRA84737.1 hypothetical protein D5F91_07575 [Streptococcus agalactiae]
MAEIIKHPTFKNEQDESQTVSAYFDKRQEQLLKNTKNEHPPNIRDYIWLEWHILSLAESYLADSDEFYPELCQVLYGGLDSRALETLKEVAEGKQFQQVLSEVEKT